MSSSRNAKARIAHILSDNGPKLLKDLMSLGSGQFLSMVVGFVAFAYLARTMPPETYGAIEFAIAITAFAAIVIECGAGTIGVRELSRNPRQAAKIATQVPVARFLMAVLVIPLVVLSAYLTQQPPAVIVLIWLFAFSLLAVPLKQDWLLQGMEKMGLAAIAQPLRTIVFALGVFVFVSGSEDLINVGLAELASVAVVSLYYLIAQRIWTVRFEFRWEFLRPLFFLKEGFFVGLSNMLWAFMLYAPMFLLVSMVGETEPAWLGAAQRIVISLLTLSFIYHFNFFPVITRTVLHDRTAWLRVMRASIRLVAWGTIGIALVFTLLGPTIMTLVFGSAFVAAAPVLAVLVWIFPVRMLAGHARWSLIANGQQKFLLLAEILGGLAVLVVAFVAIPKSQATGAALALLSGLLVSGAITLFFTDKFIGRLDFFLQVSRPVLAALAGVMIARLLSDSDIVQTVIGVGLFLVAGLLSFRQLFDDLKKIAYAKSDRAQETVSAEISKQT